MRVWHVTRTLHGGAGRYAHRLSDALRDSGIESCVLSADEYGMDEADQMATATLSATSGSLSKLTTRAVRSMSHRLSAAPYHSLMGMDRYEGERMPERGDIIHLHGMTGWMGLRGLNAFIPEDSPVFWTAHDLWLLSGGCVLYSGCENYRAHCESCPILRTGVKGWARIELKLKEKLIGGRRIRALANSNWMANHVKRSRVFEGISDVPVIPPIVDSAYFAPDIEDIRGKLHISPDKTVIALGASSVTDPYKGIPQFLDSMAKRSYLAEQCVILLFGEGELVLPECLNIQVIGRMRSADQLAKLYCTSDVFVSPSAMETFGLTLAEAQACGTPVVAFDVGGVRDAVSEECAQFLVPPGTMDGLLDAMEKAIRSATREGERLRVDRNWARQHFESKIIAQMQKDFYIAAQEQYRP